MKTSLLTFIIIFWVGPALADGPSAKMKTDDICAERPDLCGEDEVRKEAKPTKKTRAQATSGRCRKKGEPYNLDDASLPICATANVAVNEEDDESASGRAPASIDPRPVSRRISFTSYLNSNANHPAIVGRFGGKQEAFVAPVRSATLNPPGSVNVPVGDGNADGQSMKDYPTPPPSNGATPPNNQNQ